MRKRMFPDEYIKKGSAAADHFNSSASKVPPQTYFTTKSASMGPPIQGNFISKLSKKTKKVSKKMEGKYSGDPVKVSKVPSPAGPIPIPYPNIGKTSESPKPQNRVKVGTSKLIKSIMSSRENISKSGEKGKGQLDAIKESADSFVSGLKGKKGGYLDAVNFGLQMFKISAGFRNINIYGNIAVGTPGCLDGPLLESHIKNAPSTITHKGNDMILRNAIAKGVSTNFDEWRKNVTVPALPWYPSFLAWPGPLAPPMPNIPLPLIACLSTGYSSITSADNIEFSILNNLPPGLKDNKTISFIKGLAVNIAAKFTIWLATQQVTTVMGYGPVPTFRPPFVPVGPVVNGSIIPSAGHLLS